MKFHGIGASSVVLCKWYAAAGYSETLQSTVPYFRIQMPRIQPGQIHYTRFQFTQTVNKDKAVNLPPRL